MIPKLSHLVPKIRVDLPNGRMRAFICDARIGDQNVQRTKLVCRRFKGFRH